MTKGEGFIGLLYALKGLIEAGAIWIITSAAVLFFFYYIIGFIGSKFGYSFGVKIDKTKGGRNIILIIFLLFIIFSLYSLIALTGAVFGVNSSPSGGLLRE